MNGLPSIKTSISKYLEDCKVHHQHLCPRQVLGVRMGLAGAAGLGLSVPRQDKRLLVIVESDGCFVDGISVVTGSTVGHRTLRVEDYGKIAATFVDVVTENALRLVPCLDLRQRAHAYAHEEKRHYFAQLLAYQVMPDNELLSTQAVSLTTPVSVLVGRPGVRVNCSVCGEEIINEREVYTDGNPICRACAGGSYYIGNVQRTELFPVDITPIAPAPLHLEG
jgi:formylmethanofuran dehydrogenase subunit E